MPPHSNMEGRYLPAMVETARIVNVNVDDWSVDCVSEYADKRWFDIQVMSPYFHFFGGEGIYVMPEVGALVYLMKASAGEFAAPFVLGFQAPFDESNASFRANRQNLNPGDIMMKTRDDNFIILRRGGVLQIGATPLAQRIYIPLQNVINDFCENYKLSTFGGELNWITLRDDSTTTGDVGTFLEIKAKSLADEKVHNVILKIGFHGDSDPNKLTLRVFESGDENAELKVSLDITKDGDVNWNIERSWLLTAKKDIIMVTEEGDITVDAANDGTFSAQEKVLVKSGKSDVTVDGKENVTVTSGKITTVTGGSKVNLGSGDHPNTKADELASILTALLAACTSSVDSLGVPIAALVAVGGAQSGNVSKIVSSKVFTE